MPLALLPAFLALGLAPSAQQVQLPQSRAQYPVFEQDHLPPTLYAQRRQAVKNLLGHSGVAVIFTNPSQNRSNDTDFRFRPNSYYRYLTGFEEPNAALVLAPGGLNIQGKTVTEVLLCNTSTPMSQTWLGYRMNPEGVVSILGLQSALPNKDFPAVLEQIARIPNAKLAPPIGGATPAMPQQLRTWREAARIAELPLQLETELDKMRVKKDPLEIALLQKAVDASVDGHIEAMKSARPDMREYEIQAVVEYAFMRGGCESVGYNSIVGSGPNSCILHYEADRRLMKDGDIICMDVAGEYHGYTADITRSFPVNGKFSPEQRVIYNLVLEAQNAGIAACRVGSPFGAPHAAAAKVISDGLIRLGIIKQPNETNRYFMHGTSHYIGLDVHDSHGDNTLQANYTLTVEPGIYIKEGSPCDKKWWNIGVRIEDDILVTAGGPVNMSIRAPRTVEQIEALMRRDGLGNLEIGR